MRQPTDDPPGRNSTRACLRGWRPKCCATTSSQRFLLSMRQRPMARHRTRSAPAPRGGSRSRESRSPTLARQGGHPQRRGCDCVCGEDENLDRVAQGPARRSGNHSDGFRGGRSAYPGPRPRVSGKVEQLTAAFEDEALKAQAFERLRALIEAVVLTPEDGTLAIELRDELAAMPSLCAGTATQKASAGVPSEALQVKMVAGSRTNQARHSLSVPV